jgi:microsomal epoxide hydrolase
MTDINFIHTFQKPEDLSAEEEKYLAHIKKWQETEGAYAMIQATRPQTLATGLNDSPAALAAWIIEKFQSMSDCPGNLYECYTKDEMINNIMIYWLTEKIGSSFHLTTM